MEEKVIKTVEIGLGITLDIYNNRTYEFTTPGEVYEKFPDFAKELEETTKAMMGKKQSHLESYKIHCAVFNKLLVANGLPEITEKI